MADSIGIQRQGFKIIDLIFESSFELLDFLDEMFHYIIRSSAKVRVRVRANNVSTM